MNVVLHEGGMQSQPQVSLLLGGKTLSIQWKMPEKLFSNLQALVQGFATDSSRFMGYSNTIQEMKKAGVVATEGYYRRWNPTVRILAFPTKETVLYNGKKHIQFDSMYVCTLKVVGDRHGITAQAQRGGVVDFGFLGSQNSASINRGGGDAAAAGGNTGQQGRVLEDSDDTSDDDEEEGV